MATSLIAAIVDARDEPLPSAHETLRSIGRRLSESCSEQELTALATRGDRLLAKLDRRERAALARNYLRFQVDRTVIVDVAVPRASVPFWIHDQGFRPTDLTLNNDDGEWATYRKIFSKGWIGLGVNGLDRTPPAHYVVFVRPSSAPGTPTGMPVIALSPQASTWQTTRADLGLSAANDAHKPFRSLPGELAGALVVQPSHEARHSALLATGRVWKSHVVSSASADQVAIAFGADPTRELVWTWRTKSNVTRTAIRVTRLPKVVNDPLTRQAANSPGTGSTVATGVSELVEVPNLLNDPVIRRHRVEVGGLEPDTVYQYSLPDGTDGGWGPWRTVKTAPARSRGAKFLYLGDAQTGLERWGRLLTAAYNRHPGIDFVVLAGDLVDRGNERTNWDHFFLRAAPVFDRLVMMPCVGNHEYLDMGPRLYRAFFAPPHNGPSGVDDGLVYFFECGDACFAVLDSTLAVSDEAAAIRQAKWLDSTFAGTSATWKFVIFHHPVYPSHPWRDTPALRKHWVPIFDKHKVDLVLQGHDHAYLRTYPMRGHRPCPPGQGTTYVIAVSGDKFVDQAQRPYIEVGRSGLSTYQTVEIDAQSRRMTYRAWTEDGDAVDTLVIEKTETKGQVSPSMSVAGVPGAQPR
jgi:3',5'-cyclic AMP phosphodiesterase CpdA